MRGSWSSNRHRECIRTSRLISPDLLGFFSQYSFKEWKIVFLVMKKEDALKRGGECVVDED